MPRGSDTAGGYIPEATGSTLIAIERQRQIDREGWTPEHDDQHINGELADAAAFYASTVVKNPKRPPPFWPWGKQHWKPAKDESDSERIRELVKAGALIAAEIDRLLRAKGGG